jgi:GT2 family glycosyltransferase
LQDASQVSVTVAVVPREKFSCAALTLDALLANTELPFELIYIDGNSPRNVSSKLERALAERPRTRLLRFEHFLGPLQSRNIAIREAPATAEYLVILDNDVFVRKGWLTALLDCARAENAGAVVPCVLIGPPDTDEIHHAGGETGIRAVHDETELFHLQYLEHEHLSALGHLTRRETRLLEDHCILARTELWRSFGTLNEAAPLMTSVPELSLLFQRSGQKLMMEPEARVVYMWGPEVPLGWEDLPLWYLAWSERWGRRAMRNMARELGLSKSRDRDKAVVWWMNDHRRVPLYPLFDRNRRLFERLGLPWAGKVVQKMMEKTENTIAAAIAEGIRLTDAGKATGCPPLFSPAQKRG